MIPFDELALFAKVAENSSFSAAARKMGISRSAASDYVNRLEARLELKLLQRSTRHVALTDAGAACYEHAVRMIANAEDATAAAMALHTTPRGLLRVSCPETFAEMHVAPLLGDFLRKYPDVAVEISEGVHHVDLIGQRFDLAIRIGDLADSSLTTRRLAASRMLVVAAPSLLERVGHPESIGDLEGKPAIQFTPFGLGDKWILGDGQGNRVPIRLDIRLHCNSGASIVAAAEAGIGFAYLPIWMAQDALSAKRLVQCLELTSEDIPISAVHAGGRLAPSKVRCYMEHMVEGLRGRW